MLNLKKYRLQSGFTQTQIALKLGVVKNTVSQWETGVREPSITFLIKLAEVLRITVDDLVGSEKMENNLQEVKQDKLTEGQKNLIEKIKTLNERQCTRLSSYADCLIDELKEQEHIRNKTFN